MAVSHKFAAQVLQGVCGDAVDCGHAGRVTLPRGCARVGTDCGRVVDASLPDAIALRTELR